MAAGEADPLLVPPTTVSYGRMDVSTNSLHSSTDAPSGNRFTVWCCLSAASVELYLGLTMFVTTLLSTPLQELMIQKACIQYYNLSLNRCEEMFGNDSWDSEVKNDITRMTSNYQMYGELISMAPSIVLGLFIGPWSDHYGRKIPMVVATVFSAIKIIGFILNVAFFDLPLPLILLPQLVMGLGGGSLIMTGLAYSLASEQTTEDNRTLKFYGLQMSFLFFSVFGFFMSGQLYKHFGFLAVFITAEAVTLLAVMVVIVLIRDSGKVHVEAKLVLRKLFMLENVRENVRTVLKKRLNHIHRLLWVMIVAMCVTTLCGEGVTAVTYLFTVHNFAWSVDYYTLVETVGSTSCSLAMIPITIVLTKIKKVPDYFLGLLGCFSQVVQNLLLAASAKEGIKGPYWLFYLAYPAGMAGDLASVAIRSRISMLVSTEELGKVFCLLVLCESIVPLAGVPIFTALFNGSLDFFSGLPYFVAACFLIVPIVSFLWVSRIPLQGFVKLDSENTTPSDQAQNAVNDSH